MNKKYLLLTIILFIPIISFSTYNIANAHTPDIPHLQGLGLGEITHVLGHILEEEQKQTALLDHMDCINTYTQKYPFAVGESRCGAILNYTGVYHP